MKKNILVLVNPHSGTGTSLKASAYLKSKLNPELWTIKEIVSPEKDYFIGYLKTNNLADYQYIVVVGGDGTMHEVVNGIAEKNDVPPILLFPCGSGNAFNHDVNCLDWDTAIRNLEKGKVQPIDVFKITFGDNSVLYSFNIVGWGLVSNVNLTAEKLRWIGTSRYTVASLIEIFRNKRYKNRVVVDGEVFEGDFCFVLACNTKHTGKAMKIAPLAELSDGLMDILVVKHLSILNLLKLFPQIFSGSHIDSPLLDYKKAKHYTIGASNDILNIDGEIKGQAPIEVAIMPQYMAMVVG